MTAPTPVWDIINGFGAYWALIAALDLGLFDALDAGPRAASDLADDLGVRDDADLELLLELLAALELADTDGARWSSTPAASRFLTGSSPASMVDLVRLSPGAPRNWEQLAETIRRGEPTDDQLRATDALHPEIAAATGPTQRAVAAGLSAHLVEQGIGTASPITIVDLGCGSGAWLDRLLEGAHPGSRAVGVDLPHVVDRFRHTTPPAVELVAGDYLEADVGVEPGSADLVVLAHVLRADGEERARDLIARGIALLRDGGRLIVADYFVPGRGHTTDRYRTARHDLTLALTMRAGTTGRGITLDQLTDWCEAHGAEADAVLEPVPRQTVHVFINRNPTHDRSNHVTK